jgi:hypothetical protein
LGDEGFSVDGLSVEDVCGGAIFDAPGTEGFKVDGLSPAGGAVTFAALGAAGLLEGLSVETGATGAG